MQKIWRYIINDFKKRVCNERGFWGQVAAAVAAAATSAGTKTRARSTTGTD